MKFLFPDFLWALSLLAIPIAIHLFNFRRIKRVYFSNVRLLKEVKTKTNSFRRLKHLLILLSRLAFISFLVLAFAQPFIPSKNQKAISNLSGLVSIYLDNSFSMQSELGNDNYLDLALSYTDDLVKVFPNDTRFQLITNDFENKEQYPSSTEEIQDRLTEFNYSNSYRELNSVYDRQFSLLDRYAPEKRNQVFWFSDFQKSTSGDIDRLALDSLNQYYIVPIKSEGTPNIVVDSVWLSNPFIKAMETNQINLRLKSFNSEDLDDVVLKLFIDDQQVSTTRINLPAQASGTAFFNFTVQGEGLKACRISFEDYPVTFDNDYFFVINASPSISILHLYEQNPNSYVDNVYSNESVFDISSYNINSLDYNLIKQAELIVLNEVENVEGELASSLREFIQEGGSLMIFPGRQSKPSLLEFLTSIRVSGAQAVRPDSLGSGKTNELALLNVQNPFYQGVFEKVPGNMNMPYGNAVLRWNNLGDNILLFKNRRPFLSKFSIQRGNVYLFASPLENEYSNFAKHAIFVPIMYKIASSSKSSDEKLAYTFQDKSIRLKVKNPAKDQVYKLKKGELEMVPDQRIIGDELLMELPEMALEAGYYNLMLGEKQENIIALNYGKEESVMDFYSLDEIKNRLGNKKNVQIFDFEANESFIEDFKNRNIQVNLWKYMLILALVFLFVEILLIRIL